MTLTNLRSPTVCRAPCNEDVPLDWEYKVQGEGMKSSRTFHLEASAGESIVHVDPASKGWFIAGIVGMSTGGAAAVIGFLVGAARSFGCGFYSPSTSSCHSQVDSQLLVTEALAGALFVSGTASTFANLSTTISQGERPDTMPADQEVWHTAWRREALPFPAAVGAPLLTVRF
jgi:hypothetical protein